MEIDKYVKNQSDDRRWPIYNIVVGLLGIAIYLVSLTGVPLFLTDFVATTLVLGMLFGVVIFQHYYSWRRAGFELDTRQLTKRETR